MNKFRRRSCLLITSVGTHEYTSMNHRLQTLFIQCRKDEAQAEWEIGPGHQVTNHFCCFILCFMTDGTSFTILLTNINNTSGYAAYQYTVGKKAQGTSFCFILNRLIDFCQSMHHTLALALAKDVMTPPSAQDRGCTCLRGRITQR